MAVKETVGFQAEVQQLLPIIINSVYSEKEIFLRELISNASDALEKLRVKAVMEGNDDLYEHDPELKITVDVDSEGGTLTITDNGIGMTREEVINNLGTIARSGTREMLKQVAENKSTEINLIGQFGIGFYSSFIVADQVTVETRAAGHSADQAVRWESNGKGEYSLENISRSERGTAVTLHLTDDSKEFLEDWQLRRIVNKYSDHMTFPILMKSLSTEETEEKKSEDENGELEYERINQAKALWTRNKKDITDEEYKELYKHLSHDMQDPLTWSHRRVEGKLEYTSLVYIPTHAPFNLLTRQQQHGLKLFVQRVFIMDDAEQFLPTYLRFVRGLIDSNDLPLNISREILQSHKMVETIKTGIVKNILDLLDQLSEDVEKYQTFWNECGVVFKEGIVEDFANKDRIAGLLRFASTDKDSPEQTVSLKDYVARMQPEQTKIYYITADTYAAAKNSPYLEVLEQKGVEVLLLSDKVDEWVAGHLTEFDGKPLQSIARGELDLGNLENEETKKKHEQAEKDYANLLKQVKEVLGERVKEVRLTSRLKDTPACIVADDTDISGHMQRILQAAGQEVPEAAPIFELNPDHPLVERLNNETDQDRVADWSTIMFDQALLAEGGHLQDAPSFIKRLNKLLLELSA